MTTQRRLPTSLTFLFAGAALVACSDPPTASGPALPAFAGPLQGDGESPSGGDGNGGDPAEGQTDAPGNDVSDAPSGDFGNSEQVTVAPPSSMAPDDDGSANPAGDDGASDDGSADQTPDATDDGSSDDPDPPVAGGSASAGCGRAQGIPGGVAVPNTIVTFPPSYDGSTPIPLVFGFHGAGRTNLEQRTVDSRTADGQLEARYVMAYVKSAGNAWDIGADYPRFEAVLAQMLSELCIDTDALFAFGHSSGAQFIVQMLGDQRARETRFAGVVPVASSRYFNPAWSPVPTLVIHGLNDNQRGGDESGASDIVQYVESNQCSGNTQPLDVPGCASLQGGVNVNPGCVQYAGCAAPTTFCNHDDPNYQNTNHGWPCFANDRMLEFFESLR